MFAMISRCLVALFTFALLTGCNEERRADARSAFSEVMESWNEPEVSPVMVGNYRLKLEPGLTGRGGVAILKAADGKLTVRGQYEATGPGQEFRGVIPEQTAEATLTDGILRVALTGYFKWEKQGAPATEEDTVFFVWGGEGLPFLCASSAPTFHTQPIYKVSAGDAAITTAPVHADEGEGPGGATR